MKNPLLDAIRQMKAKRVAIVVGDADELGLPNMSEGIEGHEPDPELESDEEIDQEAEEYTAEEDGDSDLQGSAEEYADDDEVENDDEQAAAPVQSEAEKVLGRKPFGGKKVVESKSDPGGQEIPDDVAAELIDQRSLDRMKASGRKPNGLFQRAQAGLAERLKKRK